MSAARTLRTVIRTAARRPRNATREILYNREGQLRESMKDVSRGLHGIIADFNESQLPTVAHHDPRLVTGYMAHAAKVRGQVGSTAMVRTALGGSHGQTRTFATQASTGKNQPLMGHGTMPQTGSVPSQAVDRPAQTDTSAAESSGTTAQSSASQVANAPMGRAQLPPDYPPSYGAPRHSQEAAPVEEVQPHPGQVAGQGDRVGAGVAPGGMGTAPNIDVDDPEDFRPIELKANVNYTTGIPVPGQVRLDLTPEGKDGAGKDYASEHIVDPTGKVVKAQEGRPDRPQSASGEQEGLRGDRSAGGDPSRVSQDPHTQASA